MRKLRLPVIKNDFPIVTELHKGTNRSSEASMSERHHFSCAAPWQLSFLPQYLSTLVLCQLRKNRVCVYLSGSLCVALLSVTGCGTSLSSVLMITQQTNQ